ncbi:MAG TPA: PqqD family protein [Verrucomicrobiales bacterium]|nr:PqqD family protein [Verrucomicrobiales bacterium]
MLFRELEGEAVILNLNDDSYYGLDEVGTRLWQLLISSDSLGAACEAMLEEYDVPPDTLRRDVEEFVRQLLLTHGHSRRGGAEFAKSF